MLNLIVSYLVVLQLTVLLGLHRAELNRSVLNGTHRILQNPSYETLPINALPKCTGTVLYR